MESILYHIEDIDFQPYRWELTVELLKKCIIKEGKECGVLNYILCSDSNLLNINKKYLNHNTLTDVITFNYVEGNVISGDIFISIERVIDNAKQFKVTPEMEFLRVAIHGLLHLLDYDDKTTQDAQEIRAKEDFYLNLYSQK